MLRPYYYSEIEIRTRQINTLKVFNDNVIEAQEGCEYHVLFHSGGNEMKMQVLLGKDFPKEKPVLKIVPLVIHNWVNSDGEITSAPGLLNFTPHSDLGRVVQAIIREFERNPPLLASEQSANSIISSSLPTTSVKDAMGKSQYNYNMQSFSPPPIPTTSTAVTQSLVYPSLSNLSMEELQLLNESVDKQYEFIDNLPQTIEINKRIDELISQIEELADSNLSKQERLQRLQSSVKSRIEEVTKLAFENERLNVSYKELAEKYSPKNIKEKLRGAAEESDAQSDEIADKFLNGQIDVDQFLNRYIKSRSLSHMRKAKEEKLAQQLINLERAGF